MGQRCSGQRSGDEQYVLLCDTGHQHIRRIEDPYAPGRIHGTYDSTEDIMLLRFVSHNGTTQDRNRKRHQNPGIQQAPQPSFGLLLAAEER